ncbi:MAG: DUF692 family multinuclear iron-containing protein [Planctomycetota bacterium]
MTLQPDRVYLDLVEPLARDYADYVEVAPETLWRRSDDGRFVPNGYHARLRAWLDEQPMRVVGHGTGLSLCSMDPRDDPRFEIWLERLRADHAEFDFQWYTDHLGASVLAGHAITLPMPVPLVDETADRIAQRLARLATVVQDVGFENTVHYFLLGDGRDEPAWIRRALAAEHSWLLLDLHNLFTMEQNLGLAGDEWLAAIDLNRVVEIHVSGGVDSPRGWLPNERQIRLDSHDADVPEPVWSMLETVLCRCPNLRGVTLERMEGSLDAANIDAFEAELVRLRGILDESSR